MADGVAWRGVAGRDIFCWRRHVMMQAPTISAIFLGFPSIARCRCRACAALVPCLLGLQLGKFQLATQQSLPALSRWIGMTRASAARASTAAKLSLRDAHKVMTCNWRAAGN